MNAVVNQINFTKAANPPKDSDKENETVISLIPGIIQHMDTCVTEEAPTLREVILFMQLHDVTRDFNDKLVIPGRGHPRNFRLFLGVEQAWGNSSCWNLIINPAYYEYGKFAAQHLLPILRVAFDDIDVTKYFSDSYIHETQDCKWDAITKTLTGPSYNDQAYQLYHQSFADIPGPCKLAAVSETEAMEEDNDTDSKAASSTSAKGGQRNGDPSQDSADADPDDPDDGIHNDADNTAPSAPDLIKKTNTLDTETMDEQDISVIAPGLAAIVAAEEAKLNEAVQTLQISPHVSHPVPSINGAAEPGSTTPPTASILPAPVTDTAAGLTDSAQKMPPPSTTSNPAPSTPDHALQVRTPSSAEDTTMAAPFSPNKGKQLFPQEAPVTVVNPYAKPISYVAIAAAPVIPPPQAQPPPNKTCFSVKPTPSPHWVDASPSNQAKKPKNNKKKSKKKGNKNNNNSQSSIASAFAKQQQNAQPARPSTGSGLGP